MSVSEINVLMRGAIIEVLKVIVPILGVTLVVGLVVAILQAITSIQEQTLTFLPKLLVILLILALFGGFFFSGLGQYTIQLFSRIPDFSK
jgi:flagellar biosynthesis protein FliQ